MNYRNARFNADGVTVDLELEHPQYGWIPFTASPDDSEEHGRKIYDAVVAAGSIAPYAPTAEELPTIPPGLATAGPFLFG